MCENYREWLLSPISPLVYLNNEGVLINLMNPSDISIQNVMAMPIE
jgi:hypothetical protein